MLDAAVYINLDSASDRRRHMEGVAEAASALPGMPEIRRWPATRRSPGKRGCALSHRKVMEWMLGEGMRNVLVMEDDVHLDTAAWGDASAVLASGGWDVFYLGGTFHPKICRITGTDGCRVDVEWALGTFGIVCTRGICHEVSRLIGDNGEIRDRYRCRKNRHREILGHVDRLIAHTAHRLGYRCATVENPPVMHTVIGRSSVTGRRQEGSYHMNRRWLRRLLRAYHASAAQVSA